MSDSATSGALATDSRVVLSEYVTLRAAQHAGRMTAPVTLASRVTSTVATVGELAFGQSYISAEPTR